MDQKTRAAVSTLAVCCLLFAIATAGVAKEKPGKGGAKGRKAGASSRVEVEFRRGGPPPWAPAHGYRGHGASESKMSTAYVAPFNLDLGRCNRGTLGAALGGAAGGVLGSRVGGGAGRDAAIIGGTILGVIVGQSIGRWMDDLDVACVGQVLEHTPTRQSVEWVNPDNGVVYEVTPTDTYSTGSERYCREFQTQAQIGGRTQQLFGTACRQPDGSWERVER